MQLQPPSRKLGSLTLQTKTVQVSRLYRISRHSTGEPFFGQSTANRFDDPLRTVSKRYGTCYCGLDLDTAIAETILHDELAVRGQFAISFSDFSSRHLVRFTGGALVLADLTGPSLKTLGGDGSISTIVPYRLPQLWSRAVHRHPSVVDGIYYISRHLNDRPAVVIFDRARHKLIAATYTPLPRVRAAMNAVVPRLHISFQYT